MVHKIGKIEQKKNVLTMSSNSQCNGFLIPISLNNAIRIGNIVTILMVIEIKFAH